MTVLHATGCLSVASAEVLRRAIGVALTGLPELLVIDVTALQVADDGIVALLPLLVRRGAALGTTVMLLRPTASLLRQLAGVALSDEVPIVPAPAHPAAALDEVTQPRGPHRAAHAFKPVPTAAAEARRFVEACCARWSVTDLADVAAQIVTELVVNAIQHAGTAMTVSVTLHRTHLRVAVRDRSAVPPRRDHDDAVEPGRGLLIVEGLASAWGYSEVTGGKVVWATLRAGTGRARHF